MSLQKNLAKLVHKLHYLQVFTICIAVCVCQIYHSPYLKPNLQYAACFKPQSMFQSQNLYVFFSEYARVGSIGSNASIQNVRVS